jgi:glycosyltransferase involved in cell wall biosynthesis
VPNIGAVPAPDPAPVLLFLPAHDEADAVATVISRVPATVRHHPVRCLVIDDGSTDRTASVAHAAGAEVVSFATNRGLGAAVRAGLAAGVSRGAAVVAFCDADGEYAPEELERLCAPILDGEADYVVGSRFADGRPRHMLLHRMVGNRALTRWVRLLTRLPVTDGQSGYRALSPAAAADAEVIHDFNYAQVLTLDLVAKGHRYAEVPISYRFRTTGTSFVKLVPYLRQVIPAVRAERRSPAVRVEPVVVPAVTGSPAVRVEAVVAPALTAVD